MSRIAELEHELIDVFPDELEGGVLYISLKFTTMVHLCCCGCGNQVYTPLKPNRWRLTFDGERMWVFPSIGNWDFPCESHYLIEGSKIRWAPHMSRAEVEIIRERAREGWVPPVVAEPPPHPSARGEHRDEKKRSRWERVKRSFSR